MNDTKKTVSELMREATRLVRAGELGRATEVLGAAWLPQSKQPPGPHGAAAEAAQRHAADVIDVEARTVDRTTAPSPPPPARPPTAPAPTAQGDRFVDGLHGDGAHRLGYKLYVPPAAATGLRPLVVMLHGCTQNPDDFAAGTGMNTLARRDGCYVLYPAQTQRANNARCWNWFKHTHQQRDRGEPALIAAATRAVIAAHPIDPRRVFVAGLSAGGAMAAILGATHPDLFAAVGVHSGLAPGAANDVASAFAVMRDGASAGPLGQPAGPARPGARNAGAAPSAPTIVFQGDADTTVHPRNAMAVIDACLQTTDAVPQITDHVVVKNRRVTRSRYGAAGEPARAELWLIEGAGHAWSGGSAAGSYADPLGPPAADEMLRFFREHPLPGLDRAAGP